VGYLWCWYSRNKEGAINHSLDGDSGLTMGNEFNTEKYYEDEEHGIKCTIYKFKIVRVC
jgi:hypothetical protein